MAESSSDSPSMLIGKIASGDFPTYLVSFIANNSTKGILLSRAFLPPPPMSGNTFQGQSSKFATSLAVFRDLFWIAFVANNVNGDLLTSYSTDSGFTWTANNTVNQSSKAAPSMAVFNNQLWLAFVANNSSNDLLVCSSPDGMNWSPNTGSISPARPRPRWRCSTTNSGSPSSPTTAAMICWSARPPMG